MCFEIFVPNLMKHGTAFPLFIKSDKVGILSIGEYNMAAFRYLVHDGQQTTQNSASDQCAGICHHPLSRRKHYFQQQYWKKECEKTQNYLFVSSANQKQRPAEKEKNTNGEKHAI